MPQINDLIGAKSFELVRDRTAEILATEILNQSTLDDSTLENAPVYIERFVPFSDTEMPAVNVMLARGDYNMYTAVNQDGTYIYHIDVYHKAKTTPDGRGDMRATKKLQQLVGVVQTILSHHRYRTLGFAPPFIERVEVRDIKFADPVNSKDSNSVVMARVTFAVRVPESISPDSAVTLDGYDTSVLIANSDYGYVFSGAGVEPPAPTCAPGELRDENGVVLREVPSGGFVVLENNVITNSDGSYTTELLPEQNLELPDINVTDSDGTIRTQPSVTDVVCTPNEIDVYINRILVAEDATEDVLLTLTDQEGNALIFTQNENELTVNIPECEDATVNINGIEVGTAPSGGTLDLNLIDQNSDVVPFTQTGNDIIVNVGGGTPVKTYLFDFYGGASLGISLRKLSVWSDYAIRVRRDSDNATLDIGFVGEDLDTVSLLAFAGSDSVYVPIWYNQNGSGQPARQTVANLQPRIVKNGVLETKNGKPAIRFVGSSFNYMQLDNTITELDNTKIVVGARVSGGALNTFGSTPINGINKSALMRFFGLLFYSNNNSTIITADPVDNDNQTLITGYHTSTNSYLRKDGALISSSPSVSTIENTINEIGAYISDNRYYSDAYFQEIIHYPTSKYADAVGIENNINHYYGIY